MLPIRPRTTPRQQQSTSRTMSVSSSATSRARRGSSSDEHGGVRDGLDDVAQHERNGLQARPPQLPFLAGLEEHGDQGLHLPLHTHHLLQSPHPGHLLDEHLVQPRIDRVRVEHRLDHCADGDGGGSRATSASLVFTSVVIWATGPLHERCDEGLLAREDWYRSPRSPRRPARSGWCSLGRTRCCRARGPSRRGWRRPWPAIPAGGGACGARCAGVAASGGCSPECELSM